MRITFVQQHLSIHQSAHIRALAERGHAVTVLVQDRVAAARQQSGWTAPDYGRAEVCVAPTDDEVAARLAGMPPEEIVILGGAPTYRLNAVARRHCLARPGRLGLMSEPADGQGVKGALRRLKYTVERLQIGRRFDFMLAMGQLGLNWFRDCGYAEAQLFPYAYLTETPALTPPAQANARVELLYVGQYIPRKGIDLLLRALPALPASGWHLSLIGSGPLRDVLQAQAAGLRLAERVTFHPPMPNAAVVQRIAESDVLVLPSRFDGWGAVINEALTVGTPVVCSDRCGAADLIDDTRGTVFAAGNVDDLADVLAPWVARGPRTPAERHALAAWAQCISGGSAAAYLEDVLRHVYEMQPRPRPPWY